ncbi:MULTISPECIES: DedA family protein [Halorussus]|uniref:DedA family protein n=1 Tax=Halorussus TaxID=1070314 RepID=UPI00209EED14|nr:VTT domain-containing protein [Halorussus vallis]USZ74100.1 VTT domain-containing protein [Halorussus vallis]
MLSPLALVASDASLTIGAVLLVAGVLLSNATDRRAVRRFVSENGTLLVLAFFSLVMLVGIAFAVVGDFEMVKQWLRQYGLVPLFLVLILEGAMLMYFAPSEGLAPAAVLILANSTSDYETIAAIVLVMAAGATVGQYALFLLAKRKGREYLLEKQWFRIDESSLSRFEHWLQRWGPIAIPLSNTLPFTRGMLTVPAGISDMRDSKFVVLSFIGSISFQTILAIFGPRAFALVVDFATTHL